MAKTKKAAATKASTKPAAPPRARGQGGRGKDEGPLKRKLGPARRRALGGAARGQARRRGARAGGRAAASGQRPRDHPHARRTPRTSSRRSATFTRALSQIKGLRKNLHKTFFDIGLVLKDIQTRRLYEAKRFPSFESFVEREIDLGKTTSLRLVRVVGLFQKEGALEVGMDRLFAGIAGDRLGRRARGRRASRRPPSRRRRCRSGRPGASASLRAPRRGRILPRGRVTITRVPAPRSLSMRTSPPCWSTILRTIERPRPVPASFVVKNGSKTWASVARLDARRPVSSTASRTASPSDGDAHRAASPPSFIASSAFITRLRTTCLSFSGSPTSTQSLREVALDRRRRAPPRGPCSRSSTSSTSLPKCTSSRTAPARPRELEELGEQAVEAPDLVADDLRLAGAAAARVSSSTGELVDVPPEQVQLQHRGVERVADLVGEVERERAHRRERLGVGGALLERAPLGDVDADAVDERRVVARRPAPSTGASARAAAAASRAARATTRAPALAAAAASTKPVSTSCVRPARASAMASRMRMRSSSGIQLSRTGARAPRSARCPRRATPCG